MRRTRDDDAPMGFMDHLMELRARLLWSLLAVAAGFAAAACLHLRIVGLLKRPLEDFQAANLPPGERVHIIPWSFPEGFGVFVSVCLFGGLALAMPFVLWQAWRFVRPALRREERGLVVPLVAFGTALFLGGAAVGYFYVTPASLKFFALFNRGYGMECATRLSEYISLVVTIMLGFGLGFQLPLVMLILSRTGLAGAAFWRAKRRHAIVLAFVLGAILTPPDVPSQVIMAACLLALYELGLFLSALAERRSRTTGERLRSP